MKKMLIALLISSILLISACNSAEQNTEQYYVCAQDIDITETEVITFEKDDFSYIPWGLKDDDICIPDAKTALKVAEVYLTVRFGEDMVNEQKPLHVDFDEKQKIWGVFGSFKPHGKNVAADGEQVAYAGGDIEIYLNMKDGKVLLIIIGE